MIWLAGLVVVGFGLALIALAVLTVVAPARTVKFLRGFASSARAHYTEQVLRLIAGAAIVVFAAEMRFAALFTVFGWLIVLTAIGLLVMPWRWHRRFAEWAIPLAIRRLRLYALGAFGLGTLVLYSALS